MGASKLIHSILMTIPQHSVHSPPIGRPYGQVVSRASKLAYLFALRVCRRVVRKRTVSSALTQGNCLYSLSGTLLCGIYIDEEDGHPRGAYIADGINKLSQGLKGSAVTSLECAAAPKCSL